MTTVVVPDPDGLTTGFQDRLDEENQIFAKVDAVTWGRDNHDLVAIFQDLLNVPDGLNAGSSTVSIIRARFTILVIMVRQMSLPFPSLFLVFRRPLFCTPVPYSLLVSLFLFFFIFFFFFF